MTCRETLASLLDFVDGELQPEERGAFSDHVNGCAWCMRLLLTYRKTIVLCQHLSWKQAPCELVDELLQKLRTSLSPGGDSR
jgi:anti-sigma factor RsiW